MIIDELRLALRTLLKSPAFTSAAIITLALAVAAATTVFSIARVVLLDPLPYPDPERLVRLIGVSEGESRYDAISYPNYLDAVAQSAAFERAAAYDEWSPTITGTGDAEILVGAAVDSAFFDVLGLRPARGRFFVPEDDLPGRDSAAVISDSLWRRRFGARVDVIGRTIHLDGRARTIVGVTRPGFTHPYLSDDTRAIDVWRPLAIDPATNRAPRNSRQFTAVARLRSGVGLADAAARIATVADRLRKEYPEVNAGRGMTVVALQDRITRDVRRPIWLLFGSVVLLLLIACVNVAGLVLARGSSRAAETAVHAALGATPRDLIRKVIAETTLLGLGGAGAGLGLAYVAVAEVRRRALTVLPRADEIAIDGRVALFALLAGVAAALLVGSIPAVRVWRGWQSLRPGARGATADASSVGAQSSLVVIQVALSVVLLMAATLVGRSMWNLFHVDTGIESGSTTFDVRAPARYAERADVRRFYAELEDRLRAVPGVTAAGATTILPLDGDFNCTWYSIDGRPPFAPGSEPCAEERLITPGYLDAIGISLIAGRGFTKADNTEAPAVAIIDESFARKHWPEGSAVGRRITVWDVSHEIVGVVASARIMALTEPPVPALYLAYAQARPQRSASIVVRSNETLETLAPAIRAAVTSVSPDVPIRNLRPMRSVVRASVGAQSIRAALLAGFGLAALLLAGVGISGVLAMTVARRRKEIGVRMTLGATESQIVLLVVGRGMRMVTIGLAAGALASLAAARLVRSMLFGVAATDPLSFAIVASLLAAAGLAAAAIPALRAASTDPLTVMRAE